MIVMKSAPRRETIARREIPVVSSTYRNRTRMFSSLFEADELTASQVRAAYRGLSAMLINYRAKIFAANMMDATVERLAEGEQDVYQMVEPEHPWVQLLRRPTGAPTDADERMKIRQAAISWWKHLFMSLDSLGHVDLIVQYGRVIPGGPTIPSGLLPLYPDFGKLHPVYDPYGCIKSWQLEYSDGKWSDLPPEQGLRLYYEHPTAPFRTAGLFERAAYEIDQILASNIFARDRMEERGLPEVMLETDQEYGREYLQKLSNDFAATYRAGSGRGVPVAHGGLKIKPLALSSEAMEFQEQREFLKSIMFMLYEVHEGLFASNSTEANAKVARSTFLENTAQPAIDEAAAKMTHEFERLFVADYNRLRIVAPNVIPINPVEQEEVNLRRLERGVPINVIMSEMGEDPVEGGDIPLVRGTLAPLDSLNLF